MFSPRRRSILCLALMRFDMIASYFTQAGQGIPSPGDFNGGGARSRPYGRRVIQRRFVPVNGRGRRLPSRPVFGSFGPRFIDDELRGPLAPAYSQGMVAIDALFRFSGVGLLALLAVLTWRDHRRWVSAPYLMLSCISVTALHLGYTLDPVRLPMAVHIPARFIDLPKTADSVQ